MFLLSSACNLPNNSDGNDSLFGNRGAKPAVNEQEGLQILCGEFTGPDKMRVADELGASLKRVSGINPNRVSIVHEADRSIVTFGPYPATYEPQGGIRITPDMRRDLNLIRSLSVDDQYPFLTATPQPLPTPDPGPPDWNLQKADGIYSLQIGIFYNTAGFIERKQAAVDWTTDLRKRGIPAYYYHDNRTGRSIVTVGAFDESAYIGRHRALRQRDPDQYIPAERDYSQEVIQWQQRGDEFRYNHENGAAIKVRGLPQASFLVRIPRTDRLESPP